MCVHLDDLSRHPLTTPPLNKGLPVKSLSLQEELTAVG